MTSVVEFHETIFDLEVHEIIFYQDHVVTLSKMKNENWNYTNQPKNFQIKLTCHWVHHPDSVLLTNCETKIVNP